MPDKDKLESEIQAEILEAIGAIPGVQVMRINTGLFETADQRFVRSAKNGTHDILCCVQVNIERSELIRSGSMQFHHPRFYTFGQMVWLEVKRPGKELSDDQAKFADAWAKSGAVCAKVISAEEALEIINNIQDYIPCEKAAPDDGVLIAAVA